MHIAHYLQLRCTLTPALFDFNLREPINYYFSDLVREGWGEGFPESLQLPFCQKLPLQMGEGGGGIEKSE